jgi:uncharacterized protein
MDVLVDPAAWLRGLAGGVLIGVSSLLLLMFNGRIAGVSGVLGGLLSGSVAGDRLWRALFVCGLVLGGVLYAAFSGRAVISDVPVSSGLVVLAGLLVGVGTRMGNGCTSGHGVCGLARLSGRSLVGTISFMAFGFLTVFVVRHVLELS